MQAMRRPATVYEAMIYQVAKETGAMAAVLEGQVDAVLLTGGMAHSERLVSKAARILEWIAPITSFPAKTNCRRWPKASSACSTARNRPSGWRPMKQTAKGREALVIGLE